MCSLSFFHYSEYLVTAFINPRSLSLDSFLLNHSIEYTLAAVSSWVEFTIEKMVVPGWAPLIFAMVGSMLRRDFKMYKHAGKWLQSVVLKCVLSLSHLLLRKII